MAISYEGIGHLCVTMKKSGELRVGDTCSVYGNDAVMLAGNGKIVTGMIAAVNSNYVSVIIRGIVTVPYTGTAPTVGECALCADGNGNVKCSQEGKTYHVLSVSTSKKTVTFIL